MADEIKEVKPAKSGEEKEEIIRLPKSKKELKIIIRVVLLAAVFGILAGGVGALVAFNYLSDYASSLATPTDVQKIGPTTRVVSPGTFESAVDKAKEKIMPALVTFYRANRGIEAEESIHYSSDVLGYGIVFTSDGWLIAPGEIFTGRADNEITAAIGANFYSIDKKLMDKITGAVFLKIEAENLAVAEMADEKYLASGDRILKILGRDYFENANILSKRYNPVTPANYLESSEVVSNRMYVSGDYFLGALAVNYEGQVIAYINKNQDTGALATPLYFLEPLMKSLLKEEKLTRPYFGAHYMDLARVRGLSAAVTREKEQGALVWSGPEDEPAAVDADSPARESEIQKGDIILSVNDEILNGQGPLSEILLDYAPGNRLYLQILRGGEEMTVSLTLGSFDSIAQ